jgi:hypothetical protein
MAWKTCGNVFLVPARLDNHAGSGKLMVFIIRRETMKKWWMTMLGVALMVGAGLLAGGCEDEINPNWEFENLSSYRVTVRPHGQTWGYLLLDPGERWEVDYRGSTIQYFYSPGSKVRTERSDTKRRVYFYNL